MYYWKKKLPEKVSINQKTDSYGNKGIKKES